MSLRMPRTSRMSLLALPNTSKTWQKRSGRTATPSLRWVSYFQTLISFIQVLILNNSLQSVQDVKFWAEYRTGIKEFTPWLVGAEKSLTEGLAKPSDLNEVKALHEKVHTFEKTCLKYLKVLTAASDASKKMTTHEEADNEVAALMDRYNKVKAVADEWVQKVDTLLKEWTLLDNTVTELNTWVAKDKSSDGENQFSLEKMESTLGELKNIFKLKEKMVEGL